MKFSTSTRSEAVVDEVPYILGGMLSVLVLLICGIFSLSMLDKYLLNSPSLAAVISAVLVDLTNTDRTAHAIGGLTVSPVLTAAAQAKADDMAAKGYFAHVSPEGKDSWYWFKQAGYTFYYAGENLAIEFTDSADVERAWMDSPTHRANILDGHFTQIGIAIAEGTYQGHQTTFVVQMFGTPATVSTPAKVQVVASPKEPTVPALATTQPRLSATPPKEVVKATKPTTISAPATTAPPVTARIAAAAPPDNLVLGTEAGSVTMPAASWWQHLLASPRTMLQYAYYALAAFILLMLAYVTDLEFHKRHLRHVAAAVLLIVLMTALFIFADIAFFATPVIAALPL